MSLLVGLAIAVVGTSSLAFAVAIYLKQLPDPETADRRGLFRWLVERDLRDEPIDTQLAIMRRVEDELIAGIDFREIASRLDDSQRQRLLQNADLLASVWFHREADRYFAAPESNRSNVIGEQIDKVRRLGIMDQLSALENWSAARGSVKGSSSARAAEANPSLSAIAAQLVRIERWLRDADPQDRPRLSQYFAALCDRMIWDGLQNAGNVRNWLPL